jgi:hypothetical protein
MAKIEYRKRKGHDAWHWCTDCTQWPTSDYDTWCGEGRPSTGELDNQCLAKEKEGKCKTEACS